MFLEIETEAEAREYIMKFRTVPPALYNHLRLREKSMPNIQIPRMHQTSRGNLRPNILPAQNAMTPRRPKGKNVHVHRSKKTHSSTSQALEYMHTTPAENASFVQSPQTPHPSTSRASYLMRMLETPPPDVDDDVICLSPDIDLMAHCPTADIDGNQKIDIISSIMIFDLKVRQAKR